MTIYFTTLFQTSESSKATLGATLSVSQDAKPQRQVSPVPTEPDDPDPEFISNQLARLKIKVRDYGSYPPYAMSSPPPPLSATSVASGLVVSHHNTNSSAFAPLTPETFDPYKGLGEFEYRLRQHPRTLAIPGKTIRRLLEIGWISEDEVSKRCSEEDKKSLCEFDERNRIRALKLSELRKRREVEFGLSADSEETGSGFAWGFDPKTGAYPYLVMRYDAIPSYAERDRLVTGVRPLFVTVDRVMRMAMASERERERDRIEAEEALNQRKKDEEEKEREESHRIEVEMLEERAKEEREEAMGRAAAIHEGIKAPTTPSAGTIKLPPTGNNVYSTPTARKRSPQQAWADDEPDSGDENEDLEAKRLRLARSQSETWYEKERREQLEKQQQQSSDDQEIALSQPPLNDTSRSQSQSPRKPIVSPSHSRNPSNSRSSPSNLQSDSQSQFIPPEKQYPAPLSAYDPELYPDAASVIESQSQSQQTHYPHYYHHHHSQREDTPPVSGEGEEEELEDTRPNALKRSPKKGLKRGLTRGRTLVQIC